MSFVELILFTLLLATIFTVIALFLSRKKLPNINTDKDIREILEGGDKLKAIKAYRQLHGVGLKKAKLAIEKMK